MLYIPTNRAGIRAITTNDMMRLLSIASWIYGTAGAYQGPVRIIHGGNDRLVPMWCSEDFVKTYGEAAELIVVEGENHRLSKKTRKVAELVTAFFDMP